MSHHGVLHLFNDAGAVADSLTHNHDVMKHPFVENRSCIHKGF
jgi:hypothetical protein